MVIDASQGATDQDAAIAGEADRIGLRHRHRGQQVGPDEAARAGLPTKEFDEKLRRQVKFLDYAPVMQSRRRRRADAAAARDRGQGGGGTHEAGADTRADRFVRDVDRDFIRRRAPPGDRSGSSRRADQRGAADVRVFHQRRDVLSLFYQRFLLNQLRRGSASWERPFASKSVAAPAAGIATEATESLATETQRTRRSLEEFWHGRIVMLYFPVGAPLGCRPYR